MGENINVVFVLRLIVFPALLSFCSALQRSLPIVNISQEFDSLVKAACDIPENEPRSSPAPSGAAGYQRPIDGNAVPAGLGNGGAAGLGE